ncbi:hypothetical protein P389DRAFT_172750 [Cystobasidium minutum MCA 4210]|uniref:uncharacterized protein n=1 Tax=Cystobasidium minutum MCA 4210 TaxID=1397322 RepID=UPI0034CDF741|eukprot:jgi/Rhomi1/172750/fgenesh1_kg.5_\
MPLLGTVLGWTSFGLASRCWQLAIQKRNIFDNLGGHALAMGSFGAMGYAYYHADQHVLQLLEQKKEGLRQQRATAGASNEGGEDEE